MTYRSSLVLIGVVQLIVLVGLVTAIVTTGIFRTTDSVEGASRCPLVGLSGYAPMIQPATLDDVLPSDLAPPERSIQSMVDEADPGATVDVPPGVYRETVYLRKPITLRGAPGAEIRGSDVWSDGWQRSGIYWTRGPVPFFQNFPNPCLPGTQNRCQRDEQIFIDGVPLVQVQHGPQPGEFAIDEDQNVIIADDPADRLVEVTTRTAWIVGMSDDVIVEGFIMSHAAIPAQSGGIDNHGYSNWLIQNNTLMHANGANVALHDADNLQLINNDIGYGGQLGVSSRQSTNVVVRGNRIHNNNVERFAPTWEAGGLKFVGVIDSVVEENHVTGNWGPGLWCDIGCDGVIFRRNRVHDNAYFGINYEISERGVIHDNVVYRNGFEFPDWGWGAGILVQNSRAVDVFHNVVAWNADGISVISHRRDDSVGSYDNIRVHGNAIVTIDVHERHQYSLAWLQDWDTNLMDSDAKNGSANNCYFDWAVSQSWLPVGTLRRSVPSIHLNGYFHTRDERSRTFLNRSTVEALLGSVDVPAEPPRRE